MKQSLFLLFTLAFSIALVAQTPEQWSRFRGPNGQGITAAVGLPTQWSETENIAWKTPIPGAGWSSPVVWNDHIFLTSATNEGKDCHLIALDRKSGKILWDKTVFTQETLFKHGRNSYATPTPVTDGERVYALFGGGSFVAADFDGNILWTNNDLRYYSHHGLGTSPILYGDLLITAINPSNEEEPKRLGWQLPWDKSYLLALDKKTGKERWRGSRGLSQISHSTPAIIQVNGKDQILSAAGSVVQGFDPTTGKLIWTVNNNGEPAVPSPAIGEGMVFMATAPTSPILGIKTDGQGDVTETHVVWQQRRNAPTTSSFLYLKPCLYAASDNGTFVAMDPMTGETYWTHRIQGRPDSSAIYSEGKIYLTSHIGTTTVLKLNADPKVKAEVVSVNEIGDDKTVQAVLAVAGKQLLVRTDKELWCIGK